MKNLENLQLENSFYELGADFFQKKSPDPVSDPYIINSNPDAIELIGLELSEVQNPQFVEWLMGWPIGWTEFAPVETVSSHWLPLMRGAFLQLQQMEENKNHD